MGRYLYIALVGLVLTALFMNLYFGTRILKLYRKLYRHRIPLMSKHIFNKNKREAELFPRYEKHRGLIEGFSKTILTSVKVAIVIFAGILIIGFVFVYF